MTVDLRVIASVLPLQTVAGITGYGTARCSQKDQPWLEFRLGKTDVSMKSGQNTTKTLLLNDDRNPQRNTFFIKIESLSSSITPIYLIWHINCFQGPSMLPNLFYNTWLYILVLYSILYGSNNR